MAMNVRSVTALVLAVALTVAPACAVKQPPAPAESIKTIMPSTAIIPPDWKSSGGVGGNVETRWIQTFADQQLEALVLEGLTNNLELKAAAARIDIASDEQHHGQNHPAIQTHCPVHGTTPW